MQPLVVQALIQTLEVTGLVFGMMVTVDLVNVEPLA
jgi:hypothetical protein